jgi:DNA-binding MurR/RpiR family transcriptional regulator
MDINLNMKDFRDLRIHLDTEIRFAKRYIKNHELEEHNRDDGRKTYYNIMEDKISILEPIFNKINEQFSNEKIRFVIK